MPSVVKAGTGPVFVATAAGLALLDDADAAAQRTTLGIAAAITGTKIDDLTAGDDNTDLNASTSKHGLLPKLNNVATDFLNGQGAWSAPAGGGGAPTTVDYLVGTASGDLSAEIVIPGLKGSPDIRVGGADDDEFDQNAAGVPSGWTSLGTMNTPNTTDALSHLHLRKQTTDTTFAGIYKAIPAARPLTIKAKLSACGPGLIYHAMGIFVAEATPGKIAAFTVQRFAAASTSSFGGLSGEYTTWTVFGTRATNSSLAFPRPSAGPIWVRVIITTDSNIAYALSPDGLIWNTIASALNPAFTLGNVGVGIAQEGAADADVYFDWIRFS